MKKINIGRDIINYYFTGGNIGIMFTRNNNRFRYYDKTC